MAEISKVVSENCGIREKAKATDCDVMNEVRKMNAENAKKWESSFNEILEEQKRLSRIQESALADSSLEITRKTSEATRLESELKAAKAQIILMEQFSEKLESQCNKTCDAKTEELNKIILWKLDEIQNLSAEVETKNSAISDLEKEVKKLKEQIEIMKTNNQW